MIGHDGGVHVLHERACIDVRVCIRFGKRERSLKRMRWWCESVRLWSGFGKVAGSWNRMRWCMSVGWFWGVCALIEAHVLVCESVEWV